MLLRPLWLRAAGVAMKRAKCWGPDARRAVHAPGCRQARPLCRFRRGATSKYHVCNCGAYWFPHRLGSGACGRGECAA